MKILAKIDKTITFENILIEKGAPRMKSITVTFSKEIFDDDDCNRLLMYVEDVQIQSLSICIYSSCFHTWQ